LPPRPAKPNVLSRSDHSQRQWRLGDSTMGRIRLRRGLRLRSPGSDLLARWTNWTTIRKASPNQRIDLARSDSCVGRRGTRTSSVRTGSLRSSAIRAARGTHPVGGGVPATGPPGPPSRGLVDGHEPHDTRLDPEPGWGPSCGRLRLGLTIAAGCVSQEDERNYVEYAASCRRERMLCALPELATRGFAERPQACPAGPGRTTSTGESLCYPRIAFRGAGGRRAASPGSRRLGPTAPTQP
jgi:hypothetical protein